MANAAGIDINLPYSPHLLRAREKNQCPSQYLNDNCQGMATLWKTVERIQDIHDPMRTRMMPMNNGEVKNYKETVNVISSQYSLSREPLVKLFPPCTAHATCNVPELDVMACPPNDKDCPFNFEYWGSSSNFGAAGWGFFAKFGGQKQFCSTRCGTGGCGDDATAMPNEAGRGPEGEARGFCQPCGACTASSSFIGDCPDYCATYIRDHLGSGDKYNYTFNWTKEIDNPYNGEGSTWTAGGIPETENVGGTINFQVWVNAPSNRWVVKKYFPDWPKHDSGFGQKRDRQCEDVEDKGKVCWAFTLQEEGFCYRASWDDDLRFIALPGLRQRLQHLGGNKEGWHQLSMKQVLTDELADGVDFWYSAGEANKRRTMAKMEFFVDLEAIGQFTYSSHRNPNSPYFVDCAGEMVESVILPSQSAAETFPNGAVPASKVAFGGAHHAALTFKNVNIPKGAKIQSAMLELVPSLLIDTAGPQYKDISKRKRMSA
jgi:hypothetical protein